MNRQELKTILLAAARPQKANVNFADAQSAAKNALNEYLNASNASVRDLRPGSNLFAIIEEVLDETVPQAVEDRTGAFAEVRTFGRGDQVKFDVNTAYASSRRLKTKALKKGARGGIYKSYRVDGYQLTMTTEVYTVGYLMTLEELLTGTRTVAELLAIVADAWIETVFVEVMNALQTAAGAAPAVNKANSTTFDAALMDNVINVIAAYGNPVIMGFRRDLSKITNALAMGSSDSAALLGYGTEEYADIRRQGYVGVYKGTPVIELPNYLISHPAAGAPDFLFNEGFLYIMPANERPVKVAFQGESYTTDTIDPSGSRQWQNHRMMGVAVLFNKAIGTFDFGANDGNIAGTGNVTY
jgi:hypothetical protein